MKLQFDPNQTFQLDAVNAVADLFDGQPQAAGDFSVIKLSSSDGLFEGQERTELGIGNRLILNEDKLRANEPHWVCRRAGCLSPTRPF